MIQAEMATAPAEWFANLDNQHSRRARQRDF